MTEKARFVRTGMVGLDLALGGGVRFVKRNRPEDRESATILIRGGPGTGKSVLAQELALRLASDVGGDVLYVCVEVLPTEVAAQREGFDGFDPARVIDLSRLGDRAPEQTKPHLILGMSDIPMDDTGVPDIGQTILDLSRIAAGRGFSPKIIVVDSLSDGYGLGSTVPRDVVDGVCKIAVEQGWVVILLEEVADESISQWTFAVDTVLSLRLSPIAGEAQAQRELLVTKHRFATCEPGPHRLQIETERIRVIPPLSAYRNAEKILVFPKSATHRSLRVPVNGKDPDWAPLHVPDGEGRCLVLHGEASQTDLVVIADAIGRTTSYGNQAPDSPVWFSLLQEMAIPNKPRKNELSVRTLHQFVDGMGWLEDTLDQFLQWPNQISRIMIGPTQKLAVYENATDLERAISVLGSLLQLSGFIAVIFGPNAYDVIHAGIITDDWVVQTPTTLQPGLSVEAKTPSGATITFSPQTR